MKRKNIVRLISGAIVILAIVLLVKYAYESEDLDSSRQQQPDPIVSQEDATQALNNAPLAFQENQGQTDEQVGYLAKTAGSTIFLTSEEIVYTFKKGVIRQSHVDANKEPIITAKDELEFKTNYFIGNDPQDWRTEVTTYAVVKYEDLYEGVDLQLKGDGGAMNYKYTLQPEINPETINVTFEGISQLYINPDGTLVIQTDFGNVALQAPLASQVIDGKNTSRIVRYILLDEKTFSFVVLDLDTQLPLSIEI